MKVLFWGTRGSIATPGKNTNIYGGNTTCVEIILDNNKHLIIDAGTGIRHLGEYLVKKGIQQEIVILVTHSHWDHIQGFPFFLPVYNPDQKVTIKGFSSSCSILQDIFSNQMLTSYFPINFEDLKAHTTFKELSFGIDHTFDLEIEIIQNIHPGGSIGFKFKDKNQIITFITDCELKPIINSSTLWDDIIKFCNGSDLLVFDSQYLPSELDKYKGFGHSTYEEASKLAIEADVKRLLLTHHDPRRTDKGVHAIEQKAIQFMKDQKSKIPVKAAKERIIYSI